MGKLEVLTETRFRGRTCHDNSPTANTPTQDNVLFIINMH